MTKIAFIAYLNESIQGGADPIELELSQPSAQELLDELQGIPPEE